MKPCEEYSGTTDMESSNPLRLGHVVAVGSVDEVVHSLHSCSDKSRYQLPGEEEMVMDAETG